MITLIQRNDRDSVFFRCPLHELSLGCRDETLDEAYKQHKIYSCPSSFAFLYFPSQVAVALDITVDLTAGTLINTGLTLC